MQYINNKVLILRVEYKTQQHILPREQNQIVYHVTELTARLNNRQEVEKTT
ncbi:22552_t:CDS:2 [Racocetra persica]|uniref:22552_t:CDS:1 n=1 Tax=Racocetra persica TaxID=160502 RepID=A0ACA9KBL2_9GLOM|nr:22552_t:CDS:2 [Racocetra persica]